MRDWLIQMLQRQLMYENWFNLRKNATYFLVNFIFGLTFFYHVLCADSHNIQQLSCLADGWETWWEAALLALPPSPSQQLKEVLFKKLYSTNYTKKPRKYRYSTYLPQPEI